MAEILRISDHEGSIIYKDSLGEHLSVAYLMIALTFENELLLHTTSGGQIGMIIQALTMFFFKNPGLYESVGGMLEHAKIPRPI